MSDSTQFITTVKQLMRLTREEKIEWEEKSSEEADASSILEGSFENLTFRLREHLGRTLSSHDPSGQSITDDRPRRQYVLEIHDQSDNSTVTSPPMKAVRDLVDVIQSRTQDDKLSEINRRLGAT
jgi:hypothetical protein